MLLLAFRTLGLLRCWLLLLTLHLHLLRLFLLLLALNLHLLLAFLHLCLLLYLSRLDFLLTLLHLRLTHLLFLLALHLLSLIAISLLGALLLRCLHAFGGARVVTVSARTGQGVEELQEAVAEMAVGNETEQGETLACAPIVRHRALLDEALAAGRRCREAMRAGVSVDLLAVDVQAALDHLGDIIGLTTPDDVLDEIFSRFCIGK